MPKTILLLALTLLSCTGTKPPIAWPAPSDLTQCAPPSAALEEAVRDILAAAPGGRPDAAALAELEELARDYGPGAVLCAVQQFAAAQAGPRVASAPTAASLELDRIAACALRVIELVARIVEQARPCATKTPAPASPSLTSPQAGAGGGASP